MPTVYDLLARYVDEYGWNWNWALVRRMIARTLHEEYTLPELKKMYAEMHQEALRTVPEG